jgi:heme exporter protein A
VRAPALRAAGLRREFAGVPVLAGVDLTVQGGEIVALLGANGAGKTTLLRVLALLLRPSAGQLELFGEAAPTAPLALRRRIGYVGHESSCYADLTGAENLAFYARLFGVTRSAERVAGLLAWSGLEIASSRPVREYSRGMRQRLALARALIHEPELLLLDEPFSGLDPQAATALEERLTTLATAGHAIVLTTHDVERVASLATRVAILHRGRIAWAQTGREATAVVIAAAYATVIGGRA